VRKIAILISVIALPPVIAGCIPREPGPRPPVVARDAGRIDADRSISTMSDTEWKVSAEPAAR